MFTLFTILILAIIFGGVLFFVAGVVSFALWAIKQSKKDLYFLTIPAETGKIVRKGKAVSKLYFNSTTGHYKEDGSWTNTPQELGWMFRKLGFLFYGLHPIYNVMKLKVLHKQTILAEEESIFKRFYNLEIEIENAEMTPQTDNSTTKIKARLFLKIEIYNIIEAVFKVSPEDIDLSEAGKIATSAFNDYVRVKSWTDFEREEKGGKDSECAKYILEQANPTLQALNIGMKIHETILLDQGLMPSPENEALEASQTLNLVAENEVKAGITRQEGELKMAKIRADQKRVDAEGERDALNSIKDVIGDSIGEYANLAQVGKTQLRVYGNNNAVPIISTEGEKK